MKNFLKWQALLAGLVMVGCGTDYDNEYEAPSVTNEVERQEGRIGGTNLTQEPQRAQGGEREMAWGAESRRSASEAARELERKGEKQVRLHEEEVEVGKRQVEEGGVRLKTEVETETVTKPIELENERVVVKRLSPEEVRDGNVREDQPFQEREVTIKTEREEPVVSKDVELKGVVTAETVKETERGQIEAQVREEKLDADRLGRNAEGRQSPQDRNLKMQVERQLTQGQGRQQPTLSQQQMENIEIQVQQGTVTLEGEVPNERLKQQVEESTKRVQGVQKVNNELEVKEG